MPTFRNTSGCHCPHFPRLWSADRLSAGRRRRAISSTKVRVIVTKISEFQDQIYDTLIAGDLLCEIETDKATMGFETPEEGFLAKILIQGGTKDVPVGQLLCIIVPDQGSVAAFANFKDDGAAAAPAAPAAAPAPAPAAAAAPPPPPPPAAAPAAAAPPPAPAAAPAAAGTGRVYASPMAKRLAEAQQLRLQGCLILTNASLTHILFHFAMHASPD